MFLCGVQTNSVCLSPWLVPSWDKPGLMTASPHGMTSGKGPAKRVCVVGSSDSQARRTGQQGAAMAWQLAQPATYLKVDTLDTVGRNGCQERGVEGLLWQKQLHFHRGPRALPSSLPSPGQMSGILPPQHQSSQGGRRCWSRPAKCAGAPQTSLILGPKPGAPLQFSAQTPGRVLHPTFNLSRACLQANPSAWPSTTTGHDSFSHKALLPQVPVSRRLGKGRSGSGGTQRRVELFGTVWRVGKDKEITWGAPRPDLRVQCVDCSSSGSSQPSQAGHDRPEMV